MRAGVSERREHELAAEQHLECLDAGVEDAEGEQGMSIGGIGHAEEGLGRRLTSVLGQPVEARLLTADVIGCVARAQREHAVERVDGRGVVDQP